jgi:hypothetical protein
MSEGIGMRLLFFSFDPAEVEEASREFASAGISCEVRKSPLLKEEATTGHDCAELWIADDKDASRATLLCVERGLGFSRRDNHHQNTSFAE